MVLEFMFMTLIPGNGLARYSNPFLSEYILGPNAPLSVPKRACKRKLSPDYTRIKFNELLIGCRACVSNWG